MERPAPGELREWKFGAGSSRPRRAVVLVVAAVDRIPPYCCPTCGGMSAACEVAAQAVFLSQRRLVTLCGGGLGPPLPTTHEGEDRFT